MGGGGGEAMRVNTPPRVILRWLWGGKGVEGGRVEGGGRGSHES